MLKRIKDSLALAAKSKNSTAIGLAVLAVYAAYVMGYLPPDRLPEIALVGTALIGFFAKDGHK